MDKRPVFLPCLKAPYFTTVYFEAPWEAPESLEQKQQNIRMLHNMFRRQFPEKYVLEISTKSMQKEGVLLSAFNLCLGGIEVEKIYQSTKVFEHGGPFDLYHAVSAKAAKQDPRLTSSGKLLGFSYEGRMHPVGTTFFHWLYLNALLEHEDLAKPTLSYDAFTDIEYGPEGLNCQARAAAVYVTLARLGRLAEISNFDRFHALFES